MPVNRIIRHLDAPPAPPADTRGRYEFVSDAVLRAVAAVTRLLDDDDPAVVLKAAKMILDVEKTRMRHGREVHGAPDPYREETREMLGPIWNNPNPVKVEVEDDFDDDEDDDEPAIRPIPYRMAAAPVPPPAIEERHDDPPDPSDTHDATNEFQRRMSSSNPSVSARRTYSNPIPASTIPV